MYVLFRFRARSFQTGASNKRVAVQCKAHTPLAFEAQNAFRIYIGACFVVRVRADTA